MEVWYYLIRYLMHDKESYCKGRCKDITLTGKCYGHRPNCNKCDKVAYFGFWKPGVEALCQDCYLAIIKNGLVYFSCDSLEEYSCEVKDEMAVSYLLWKLLNNVSYTEARQAS